MWQKPINVMIAVGALILLGILLYAGRNHLPSTPKHPAAENRPDTITKEQPGVRVYTTTQPGPIADTQPATGQSWSGVASSHKAGLFLRDAGVYVELPGLHRWPDAAEGRRVVVTGRAVVRHDLPVFIASKTPGAVAVGGIPVPEGTDLYKASERTVIEDAQWHLADKQK